MLAPSAVAPTILAAKAIDGSRPPRRLVGVALLALFCVQLVTWFIGSLAANLLHLRVAFPRSVQATTILGSCLAFFVLVVAGVAPIALVAKWKYRPGSMRFIVIGMIAGTALSLVVAFVPLVYLLSSNAGADGLLDVAIPAALSLLVITCLGILAHRLARVGWNV